MDEMNPYAPPAANIAQDRMATQDDEGRGVWRDGKILVMAKPAVLPSRCLKCNEPAAYRLKRSLSWHSPWLYWLIIFPSWIVYLIVALIVRKTAKVQFPLCEAHRARRARGLLIATGVILGGLALIYFGATANDDRLATLGVAGIFLFLFGLIAVLRVLPVVSTQKINDTHVWLKGVCPAYLAELPALPFSDSRQDEQAKAYLAEL